MEAHRPNKKRTEEKGEKEQTGGKTKAGLFPPIRAPGRPANRRLLGRPVSYPSCLSSSLSIRKRRRDSPSFMEARRITRYAPRTPLRTSSPVQLAQGRNGITLPLAEHTRL